MTMKHRFQALTVNGFAITRWTCRNCGLKVLGRRVMQQLEGRNCR